MEGFVDVSEVLRSGVYILLRKSRVVHVGKSKNFLANLHAHRSYVSEKVPYWFPIQGVRYDQVMVMPVHPDRLDTEYEATCARYNFKPVEMIEHINPQVVEFFRRI